MKSGRPQAVGGVEQTGKTAGTLYRLALQRIVLLLQCLVVLLESSILQLQLFVFYHKLLY